MKRLLSFGLVLSLILSPFTASAWSWNGVVKTSLASLGALGSAYVSYKGHELALRNLFALAKSSSNGTTMSQAASISILALAATSATFLLATCGKSIPENKNTKNKVNSAIFLGAGAFWTIVNFLGTAACFSEKNNNNISNNQLGILAGVALGIPTLCYLAKGYSSYQKTKNS